jgi:hypothetical protein
MLDFQPPWEETDMSMAIRIALGSLGVIFLYTGWVIVSAVIYQIRRGPQVATGFGVLYGFLVNTAISPLFLMAAVAVVVLAIKV